MTHKYNNVYLNEVATVVGKIEFDGPLGKCFDRHYEDYYANQDGLERAEIKLMEESIDILVDKLNLSKDDINLLIAGDLQNQITSSCYTAEYVGCPFIGTYSACATNGENIILASNMIENNCVDNCVVSVSSHNMVAEKQFRNPTEYGAPKPSTATFTSTGGASSYLSNKKSKVRIESVTVGKVIDLEQSDPNNMGACMAPAAAWTINKHLEDLNRDVDYYDLIVTGDLGICGKEILREYLSKEYNIKIKNNYNDCGVMLYDLEKQKDVKSGGSGPVCSALVLYTDIFTKLKNGKLKKVLYVPTGALFNPGLVFQKENILSIAHAVSLEVED